MQINTWKDIPFEEYRTLAARELARHSAAAFTPLQLQGLRMAWLTGFNPVMAAIGLHEPNYALAA